MDGQLPTKGVPCLRKTLNGLITAEKRGLTRLVAIAAYFEALGSGTFYARLIYLKSIASA